jgi:Dirigent-like protein
MRGRVGLVVVATGVMSALVLVVSLVTVSVAGPNVTRLAVIEHATTDTVVDLTTNGDSTGDLLTFHNELFDDANNDVVGTNQGECVRIEVGVSWECRWINFLEGGSVTVEGPFFDAGPSALAITGGTGAYRAARGSMRLVARNDSGTEYDFIFRILTG